MSCVNGVNTQRVVRTLVAEDDNLGSAIFVGGANGNIVAVIMPISRMQIEVGGIEFVYPFRLFQ